MTEKDDQEFPTPQDAQEAILSPIHKQLKDSNLTLKRLCKDLNQVIKSTKDNPNAKLKGIDMGFKLHGKDAYPIDTLHIEGETGLTIKLVQYKEPVPSIEDTVLTIEGGNKDNDTQ